MAASPLLPTLAEQRKVHDGEHGLLDHAAVVGSAHNQPDLVLDVHDHGPLAERAVAFGNAVERRHVDHCPAVVLVAEIVADTLGEHDVCEVRVGRVFANEAVGERKVGVPAAEHIGGVQLGIRLVQMIDDPLQQRLVLGWIKLLEVRLPPDVVDEFGPSDRKGVLHRTTRAGRIAVIHERSVFAQRGRIRLLRVVRTVELNPAPVVGNCRAKQLYLTQSVVQSHVRESELGCQVVSNRR